MSSSVELQHEDDETNFLRNTYMDALLEVRPDLSVEEVTTIAAMVVKKARYGVMYEEEAEELIRTINAQLVTAYT